jgi:hypothetical protein
VHEHDAGASTGPRDGIEQQSTPMAGFSAGRVISVCSPYARSAAATDLVATIAFTDVICGL